MFGTTGSLGNGSSYLGGFYDLSNEFVTKESAKDTDKQNDTAESEGQGGKQTDASPVTAEPNNGGNNTGLIIGLIAAVVVIAAIVVVCLVKKKK